jgi:hypothetical protein
MRPLCNGFQTVETAEAKRVVCFTVWLRGNEEQEIATLQGKRTVRIVPAPGTDLFGGNSLKVPITNDSASNGKPTQWSSALNVAG